MMGAPSGPVTVEPSSATALTNITVTVPDRCHQRRPGPVYGGLEGVSQPALPGKYACDCTISPGDVLNIFSPAASTSSCGKQSAKPDFNVGSIMEAPGPSNPIGPNYPTQLCSTCYSSTPGRTFAASPKEAPIVLNAVEPFQPALCSRPGPAVELRDGVFRATHSGKYAVLSRGSLPDQFPSSSTSSTSNQIQSVDSRDHCITAFPVNRTPACSPAASNEATFMPLITIVPLPPADNSPSGSVFELTDGAFRNPIIGNTTLRRDRSNIVMYYQNVNGMNGLLDDYRLAGMDECYDIIVLTETWLDSRTISSYIFGSSYEIFRCDRNKNNSRKLSGGGVLIAVSSRLKAKVVEDRTWNTVEQVWISIELSSHQLFICAVYIPPDRVRDLDLIEAHCRSVFSVSQNAAVSDEVIIFGDFNLSNVAWIPTYSGFLRPDADHSSFHAGAVKLLDSYSTANLLQINDVVNARNRSLDLCFVSGPDTAPFISTAPADLVKPVLHHPALLVVIKDDAVRNVTDSPCKVSYDFRKADYRSITAVLSDVDWQRILDPFDVNIAAQTFGNVLSYVIDRHVPKKITRPDSCVPWMTNELRSLKRSKKAALKRFTKYRTLPLKRHYIKLNYQYKRLSNSCFHRHLRGVQRRLKSHPKSFWSHVNEQRKEVGLPSTMVFNGESVSSEQEICNLFSVKFADVFEDERLSADAITAAAINVPLSNLTLASVDIELETILSAGTRLKASSKLGPDGVSATFLKKNIAILSNPLHQIFQLSLSSGVFPSCWKAADMFPVHKKGSKRDVNNYRGITSLSAASKLFELVVMDYLNAHCRQHISTDQHGFSPGRSTTTNLLCLTTYITDSMVARAQTDVVYTDLTAAFDKLNHDIAIAKLDRLGIGGTFLRWFRSYLTERQLTVTLGDCRSECFCATSGIPQGSHLGPLIFLLYFNDVHHVVRGPKLSFADDLKMFLRICSTNDCHYLQDQINAFADWCTLNRLVVNPAKCSVITFSWKKKPIIFSYELRGTGIDRVQCIKDLGVLLDSQLTFTNHVSYIVDKASRTLGFVFKIAKNFTDIQCMKSLYCSLVRSTLEYCSSVWSPKYENSSDRVESVQRRFVRYALRRLPWSNPFRLPSYESRLKLINLQPLRMRRNVCRALIVADTLQGRIDCEAILQEININVQPRSLRNNVMLRLPVRRTNYGLHNAIHGLQRTFNRVASVFDFHLTRNAIRRMFSTLFGILDARG